MLRPGRLGVDGQGEPGGGPVHWTRGELIGAGAFGRVYMGLNNETGQLMAVKQVAPSRPPARARLAPLGHAQRREPRQMLHDEVSTPSHGHVLWAAEVGAVTVCLLEG